jgi:hypothetical protein
VRSISPFPTRKKSGEIVVTEFDLLGVELRDVLELFFAQYNEDYIPEIDRLLTLYANEKNLLLTELYQQHDLSRVDMQLCINQARHLANNGGINNEIHRQNHSDQDDDENDDTRPLTTQVTAAVTETDEEASLGDLNIFLFF